MQKSIGLACVMAAGIGITADPMAVEIPYRAPAHSDFAYVFNGCEPGKNAAGLIIGATESLRIMQPECTAPIKKLPDGATTFDLDHLVKSKGEAPGNDFVVQLLPRVSVYPGLFYEARFGHDFAAYEAWKKAHPGFRYFTTYELGNDAYMKWRVPNELQKGRNPVSAETFARLTSLKAPSTREAYVADVLRPHFDRVWSGASAK